MTTMFDAVPGQLTGPLDHRKRLEERAAVERDCLNDAGDTGLPGFKNDCHGPSVRRIPAGKIGRVDDIAAPGRVTFEGGIGPGCGGVIMHLDDAACPTGMLLP